MGPRAAPSPNVLSGFFSGVFLGETDGPFLGADLRPGPPGAQAGSRRLRAWGDSNLYLRRDGDDRIILTPEHRAAPAMPSITLELNQHDNALALEPIHASEPSPANATPKSLDDRITAALAETGQPQPFTDLRARCRIRAATLYQSLTAMIANGSITKSPEGYRLTEN